MFRKTGVLIILLGLTACGGGSSDGNTANNNQPNAETSKVDESNTDNTSTNVTNNNEDNNSDNTDISEKGEKTLPLTLISSEEVITVKGKYDKEIKNINALNSYHYHYIYDIELGLDAQRRIVRILINNPQALLEGTPVPPSGFSIECLLTNINGIYKSCSQSLSNPTSAAPIQSLKTRLIKDDSRADVAVLIQDYSMSSSSLMSQKTTLRTEYALRNNAIQEPLAGEWIISRSGLDNGEKYSENGTVYYENETDSQGRTFLKKRTKNGVISSTEKKSGVFYNYNDNVIEELNIFQINAQGWQVSKSLLSSTTYDPLKSVVTTKNKTTQENTYDNQGRLLKNQWNYFNYYSGAFQPNGTSSRTFSTWGDAPNYDPLAYTRTWSMPVGRTISSYSNTPSMQITKSEVMYSPGYSAVYTVRLDTDQPVLTWNTRNECALVDRSCLGYYAKEGIDSILETLIQENWINLSN